MKRGNDNGNDKNKDNDNNNENYNSNYNDNDNDNDKHSIDNSFDLNPKCSFFSVGKKGALKNENYGKSCQQEQRMSTLSNKSTSEFLFSQAQVFFYIEVR